jgi:phosphatidylglycerophosphatase C
VTAPEAVRRPVAAFDFDGTISHRDTLAPFLAEVVGTGAFVRAVLSRTPRLVGVSLGRIDRDLEKEALIRRLLAGRTTESIEAAGAAYATRLWERRRFRPAMLDRMRWHRDAGHEIVIVSASLEVYLRPLAPLLGADHAIGCLLESEGGVVTGDLIGGNVRGPEKVRRLDAWLGDGPVELWAYGESSGADELLARADHPTRV